MRLGDAVRSAPLSLYEQLLSRDVCRKRRRRLTYSIVATPAGVPKLTKDTNILVMGLDSRVGEQGKPLPAALYDAPDAGDQSIGGYNANVLTLIRIPANGEQGDGYLHSAG